MRLVTAPGPALLQRNVDWVRVSEDPSAREIERIGRCHSGPTYALFDLDALPRAVAAARLLRKSGRSVIAARGRVVPAEGADAFEQLWLGARFGDLLFGDNRRFPRAFAHPLVLAEAWRAGGRTECLGVVFGRLPESGLLAIADVGRADVRDGAPAAAFVTAGRNQPSPANTSPQ
ncbi:MAG: hypothetical protein ACE5I7_20300, partial [Candidatus Binatia bacterium]